MSFYYDKLIAVSLISDDPKIPRIDIPGKNSLGLDQIHKPGITLEISYLPGLLVYNCIIKIVNLSASIDIKAYNKMEIEAGYRYLDIMQHEKFNVPIFTAYRTSPNPDGIAVFQGLLLGEVESIFAAEGVSWKVKEPLTVENYLKFFLLGAAGMDIKDGSVPPIDLGNIKGSTPTFHLQNRLPKAINESIIPVAESGYAENGTRFLNTVQEQLSSFIKNQFGKTLIFEIVNGDVIVGLQEGEEKEPNVAEKAIKLWYVNTIEFNGAMLDITCPFVPGMLAGRLIKVNPTYYAAKDIPSTLTPTTFAVSDIGKLSPAEKAEGFELYRILIMKLVFSTIDDDNVVTLSCLPWQLLQMDQGTINNENQKYEDRIKTLDESTSIEFTGEASNDWYSLFNYSTTGVYGNKMVKCRLGDTYIKLIRSIFKNQLLYKPVSQFDGRSIGGIDDDGNLVWTTGRPLVVSTDCLWALAIKMTYDAQQQNKNMFYLNTNHPLSIRACKNVVLPTIAGDIIQAITPDKDLFKITGDILKSQYKYTEAVAMYNLYLLLGGTL